MAQRISVLVALEAADEGLKRAIAAAERSLGEMSTSAKTAGEKAAAGLAQVRTGVSTVGEQITAAKTQLLAFLSISWVSDKVQEVVAIADAWASMNARLRLATAGQREFVAAQGELFAIAQRIGVPIQETATLYGKLQQAVRMLGGEQQQAFELTETISQALRISGASASEAQSALLQFGQALASGVLRGEEFNSVVENSPRLAQALAEGLDVPIGRLRKMAEEGKLTADVVVQALTSQKERLATEYSALPATVGQAFTRLTNAFGQWVSKVDESTGLSAKLAGALSGLAANIDTVMAVLGTLTQVVLAALAYRMIPALITAWQTLGAAAVAAANATAAAWATANLSVASAVASIGVLKTAFAVLGAFVVGWEIGSWLSEKFEIVRRAGIFMVEILMKGVEQLQYRWELFAALFTDDTIAAATARHEQRLAQMNGIFAQMVAEASKGSAAATGAMQAAGTSAEEVAKRLEAVRQGTQEAVGRGAEAVHEALGKLKGAIGEAEQAASRAQSAVNASTAAMAQAYKGLSGLVEQELKTQSDAVKARFEAEQTALELSSQSQGLEITTGTRLLAEALLEQTRLRGAASAEALRLVDAESLARRDAAQRQGVTEAERAANVVRVDNEILATKRQTLATAADDYRAHIDALNAQANRHLAEIQRIEEQKRALSLSTEERIREILRQGMSTFEATEDRKRQVAELQQQARTLLAQGEFDRAQELAKKAMELAGQVASAQSSQARQAQQAREQAEQQMTQVVTLQTQAREAQFRREYGTAEELLRRADALRAEIDQKARAADEAAIRSKGEVQGAIGAIRSAQDLLNQSLDAEGRAHRSAADDAAAARDRIRGVLSDTQGQIDEITQRLSSGLKVTLDADASRFRGAIEELDRALADKAYLVQIQADLQDAERKLREYERLLKEGKTLPVDADVGQARAALERLKSFADQNAKVELKVATDKASSAIGNVERQINALSDLQTVSNHTVATNADAAAAAIGSLQGANTSSTHTIYVRRVETDAAGGLVGAGWAASRSSVIALASGGSVSPQPGLDARLFPRQREGRVPGSGSGDTVPRTLEAGAFVLRKAAVRRYGLPALQALQGLGSRVRAFATGGRVSPIDSKDPRAGRSVFGPHVLHPLRAPSQRNDPAAKTAGPAPSKSPRRPWGDPKVPREVAEMRKMIDLGLKGISRHANWLQHQYGWAVSLDMPRRTMDDYSQRARRDQDVLKVMAQRDSLTEVDRATLSAMRPTWEHAMSQPLLWGEDLSKELEAYMVANEGEFLAKGGMTASGGHGSSVAGDTVPAMLTPGEFVVRRSAVQRLGVGLLDALNQMTLPPQALNTMLAGVGERIQGFASGGFVSAATGFTSSFGSGPSAAALAGFSALTDLGGTARTANTTATPLRTIHVELAAGERRVSATVDARDESRLLELLEFARLRAA